ncbi:hypothetical protein GCM10022234_34300 [Aeromicrobium panaciterrae]|uniref:hypothetical protein n=1 Tax=Aeromicrobium panaciterrae TaxID=363861 RepID=UPI0031D086C1
MKRALVALAVIASLAACGGDPDVVDQNTSTKSDDEKKQPEKEQGAIVDSGFGQGDDEYVGLAAIVKNKSDHAGQTVTVSFNIKDTSGEVLKTESQVDNFSWPGQELAVVTQADLAPGQKAASVEATLLIEDDGTFADDVSDDLGTADAPLVNSEYGGRVAKVQMTNPNDKILKNPKVAVVCHDSSNKIAGSGFTYPDLIAPSGKYADEIDVIVSASAKSCKVYLEPGLG